MAYRIKCIVTYDGSRFNGYQRQVKGRTVQSEIEKALSTIHKEPIDIHASGRTDAGVHALGQVFHFDSNLDIPSTNWKRAINSLLPKDIYINDAQIVNDEFHARYSVINKEYRYYLSLLEYNPIKADYIAFKRWTQELHIDNMMKAIKLLEGTHDFKSFTTATGKEYTIRTIYEARIVEKDGELEFIFKGNGFLRYQVRIMVGTLIEIGEGRKEVDVIKQLLEIRNRGKAGFTAHPQGLYLYHVNY